MPIPAAIDPCLHVRVSLLPERVRWPVSALRWRLRGHYRPLPPAFTDPLRGARVIEIGGPSAPFRAGGLVPVYPLAASVDNNQFAASSKWHSLDPAVDEFAPSGTPIGRQHFIDDLALPSIADNAYDAVISSHVIEHLANPLRAFETWTRIIRPGGHLLMIVPHFQGTFDRRRPVTPLSHLVEDHEQGTPECDATHVEEVIELHDFDRDVGSRTETWIADHRSNISTRVVHHHVFSTASLLLMVDCAGLEILQHTTRFPHDIYVLARFPVVGSRPDNAAVLHHVDPGPFDR